MTVPQQNVFSQKGITLIEVVIYSALLFTIATLCYQFYQLNIRTYTIEKIKAELFLDLKLAITMMTKDIRLCGCDPLKSGHTGFINESDHNDRYDTDTNSIHLSADLVYPWDGKINDTNEEVMYFLYPQARGLYKLGRCTRHSRRPQPVAENILSLAFQYYDLSGNIMPDPPLPLKSIGSVDISITAQSVQPNPITGRMDKLSLQTRVWVRNSFL
jgi:hypothetical protein